MSELKDTILWGVNGHNRGHAPYTDDNTEAIIKLAAELGYIIIGYIIIMMDSHRDTLLEREILRDALNMDISGVICYPLDDGYRNLAAFAAIQRAGIPLVTVDKWVGAPSRSSTQ